MKNHKQSPLISFVTILALVFSMSLGLLVTPGAHAQVGQQGNEKTNLANEPTKNPAISRYAQNLTKLARRGAFDLVAGNDSALAPTIQILSGSKQNNSVLISEDASESKTVVQLLARRIATGEVPQSLRQARLYSLNLYTLLDGVKAPADLDVRVKALLAELASIDKNSILFVGELHQFVGQHAEQMVSE